MRSFADPIRRRWGAASPDATRGPIAAPIAVVLILICAAGLQAQTAANAREVYTEALKREAEIRRDMDAHQASEPVAPLLVRLRTLVGAYADMARLFPDNDQGDQALWQGAMLSADAFWRFGDEIDRASALNLLDALATRFPGSALVAQVGPHAKRLSDAPVLTPVPLIDAGPVVAAAPPAQPQARPDPEPAVVTPAPAVEPADPPRTAVAPPPTRVPEPDPPVSSPPPAAAPPSTAVATRETTEREAVPGPATEPIEPRASASARATAPTAPAPTPSVPAPIAPSPSPSPRVASPPAPVVEPSASAARSTSVPPRAAATAGPSRLTSIEGENLDQTIRFTLALDREVGVRHEQLGGPPRIVIDLYDTIPAETLTQALLPRNADVISRIRVGRHDGTWTRVVIELKTPSRYAIGVTRDPYRVVIDVHPRLAGLSTDASVSGGARR